MLCYMYLVLGGVLLNRFLFAISYLILQRSNGQEIAKWVSLICFRYFISSLVGTLKQHGWEVCGTIDLSRHNNDKSTFLVRQCQPNFAPHMCVSFNKANRIRLIVSR